MARIKPQDLLQLSKKKGPSGFSFITIAISSLIVVFMAFFLLASYRYWNGRSKFQTADMISSVERPTSLVDSENVDIPNYAVINTSKGSITVELNKEGFPEVVNEFVELCQKGRFKGLLFTSVIQNFVIQWGHINKPGSREDWTEKQRHYQKLNKSLKHDPFMLGTSKTKNDGVGFDYFITTAPLPNLSRQIKVFGDVIEGEDVVQEIERVDTDELFRPKTPIIITEATIRETL